MANILQWIGLPFGIAVIAFGVMGFFRGLSLPPNAPEHRAYGKADNSLIRAATGRTHGAAAPLPAMMTSRGLASSRSGG